MIGPRSRTRRRRQRTVWLESATVVAAGLVLLAAAFATRPGVAATDFLKREPTTARSIDITIPEAARSVASGWQPFFSAYDLLDCGLIRNTLLSYEAKKHTLVFPRPDKDNRIMITVVFVPGDDGSKLDKRQAAEVEALVRRIVPACPAGA